MDAILAVLRGDGEAAAESTGEGDSEGSSE
jgi:hypothetical protein